MKKVLLSISCTLLLGLALCVGFLLNPQLAYAERTTYRNITIYHNGPLNPDLKPIIDLSLSSLEDCELYSADFHSDLCLNQGVYPKLVQALLGDDIFTAFSNKVVVLGTPAAGFDQFWKWDRTMKYSQFLSHALVHNLQFKHHGLGDANPLGGHPKWKWEGYVDYQGLGDIADLDELMVIINNPALGDFDWTYLTEEEGTIKQHIRYLTMVKYCFEELGWNYAQLMASEITEEALLEEMLQNTY